MRSIRRMFARLWRGQPTAMGQAGLAVLVIRPSCAPRPTGEPAFSLEWRASLAAGA
jgi:hypothetical protein